MLREYIRKNIEDNFIKHYGLEEIDDENKIFEVLTTNEWNSKDCKFVILQPNLYSKLLSSGFISHDFTPRSILIKNLMHGNIISIDPNTLIPLETLKIMAGNIPRDNDASSILATLFVYAYVYDEFDVMSWIVSNYNFNIGEAERAYDIRAAILGAFLDDFKNGTHEGLFWVLILLSQDQIPKEIVYNHVLELHKKYIPNFEETEDMIKMIFHDHGDYDGEIGNVFYNIYHDLREYDYKTFTQEDLKSGINLSCEMFNLTPFITSIPKDDINMTVKDLVIRKLASKYL